MRLLGVTAVVAVLVWPAFAHAEDPHVNLIPELASKTPEEKEADEAREKAYRDSLRKIPDAKASSDPWGTVRAVDAPKTTAPASKTAAPAKPRTKTGSAAN